MYFALLVAAATVSRANAVELEQSDDFLAGYLTSVIERELMWPLDSFRVEVRRRTAIIVVADNDRVQREAAVGQLHRIEGLEDVRVVATPSVVPGTRPRSRASAATSDESREVTTSSAATVEINSPGAPAMETRAEPVALAASPLPPGNLFRPNLSFWRACVITMCRTAISPASPSALVKTSGFYRVTGTDPRGGLQIGIAASVIALFDLDSESNDLINANYTVGIPLTWRSGSVSARLQLYHQSSHLGDEFVLRAASNRINLSYEAAEAIAHMIPVPTGFTLAAIPARARARRSRPCKSARRIRISRRPPDPRTRTVRRRHRCQELRGARLVARYQHQGRPRIQPARSGRAQRSSARRGLQGLFAARPVLYRSHLVYGLGLYFGF